MKHLLIAFVKVWRTVVSPLYGDVCKFYPTCSAYGLEALQLHGAVKGSCSSCGAWCAATHGPRAGSTPCPDPPSRPARTRQQGPRPPRALPTSASL